IAVYTDAALMLVAGGRSPWYTHRDWRRRFNVMPSCRVESGASRQLLTRRKAGSMRIAVFSDIHGNCIALETILADLQHFSVDRMVCLGDAIQGGPQPA